MLRSIQKYTLLVAFILIGSFLGLSSRVKAQTYQIDCAILLCLSGGWPASVPCRRARTEFIRRITPWPIEPPLQIWRCPMGASFHPDSQLDVLVRLYDILFRAQDLIPPLSLPANETLHFESAVLKLANREQRLLPYRFALQLVQDRANIDITGPEFNFVRSIRVYDVRYARQGMAGSEGDCERFASIFLGTYGLQGDFAWARSTPTALPAAHKGLELWGDNCPDLQNRSVFIDWRDYQGNYGFEQINY